MNIAYIDTSALVAVAFNEPSASILTKIISRCDKVISSSLLEAEIRSAFARENVNFPESLLSGIGWILPERPLTQELAITLDAGYLRGADLWHVASALYAVNDPQQVFFATLDYKQERVARAIGFQILEK
ncbi:MAG: type II toxin-antitoxin system VapC family toxin [Gammaproteobacteria bacterium]|nr:type II toxin-antitoxin system VapC family toxin [Gammaproteobacteria bacterium]